MSLWRAAGCAPLAVRPTSPGVFSRPAPASNADANLPDRLRRARTNYFAHLQPRMRNRWPPLSEFVDLGRGEVPGLLEGLGVDLQLGEENSQGRLGGKHEGISIEGEDYGVAFRGEREGRNWAGILAGIPGWG